MGSVIVVWAPFVTVRPAVVFCVSVVSVFGFDLVVIVFGFVLVLYVFVRVFGFCGCLIRRSVCFVLRGVGLLLG
ncbi:hypothetical protein PN414_13820 [Halorubrum ezzemoulense]|uniref:Uncharacterized protein n=1 Tax=Halorubrum salinarum TaxID=2739057 RepID=A0A7D4CUV3_9EURY|nr:MULTISPECIES: hypothetical protein [Halorubrum]MDB9234666.1 hypothetical protein [Halorubrum ezzemoulense]MDB9295013.1 hypothetical protein [Halorubrum ezzemoulense]QKG94479.1 hypothetical protein HPS36_16505 [Halorubrum salinarum]